LITAGSSRTQTSIFKNWEGVNALFEFERTADCNSLYCAWMKVRAKNAGGGCDGIDPAYYENNLTENLEKLHYSLLSRQYAPYPEKSHQTRDRRIFVSCLEDKIVQTSIATVLQENINFPNVTHGYIKNRSVDTAHASLRKAIGGGLAAFYKADIKKFYESIDRELLLKMLRKIIGDERFIGLMRLFLLQHATGISTGSCLSPVLSNLYLLDFDKRLKAKASFYSRYADDILIAPVQGESMDCVINDVGEALDSLHLTINPQKSGEVNAFDGFRYLGFDIKQNARNDKIESLIAQGDYALAEKLMQQRESKEACEPADDCDFGKYVRLFVRDTDHYYLSADSQNRYVRRDERLDDVLLRKLIGAHREFAVPALNKSGLCGFAVFDIDINRKIILENGDDGKVFDTLMKKALETALRIRSGIADLNMRCYLEFSGYKGYHVWVFWEEAISLTRQKLFFNNILTGMDIPEGLHVEKFPISAGADQIIKLPLSRHSVRGTDALFLAGDSDQKDFIETILPCAYPDIEHAGEVATPPAATVETPAQIKAIYEKCHVVKAIVNKAKNEHYIGYHEKTTLLHIFHCLGEAGAAYLHRVFGFCIDYDYAVTQKHIDGCNCGFPVGCKKIMERFDGVFEKSKCHCDFRNAGMYPSPVVHAKRILPDCCKLPEREEKIGHFKRTSAQERINESIARLIELNKKEYDIHSQKRVCNGQIENLFSKNAVTEMQTPQGLLIKTRDGLFLKIGN
jgi:hypothetical protein